MPRGRIFAPPTQSDGVWFQHRGLPSTGPLQRATASTTGFMLAGPWQEEMASYPPQPPQPYIDKNARNFKKSNNFSMHDNRHSFQDHGVYFGNGETSRDLGKRNTAPAERQHHSDKDYLKHLGRHVVNHDYRTTYGFDYFGAPTQEPPTRRRFPRQHTEVESGLAKLTTKTTSWYDVEPSQFCTPLQLLATSQEPFLPANSWKYSNHGRAKCYPPYDRPENKYMYPSWATSAPPALKTPVRANIKC